MLGNSEERSLLSDGVARGCFLASAASSRTVAGRWELSGEGFIDRTDTCKGTEV